MSLPWILGDISLLEHVIEQKDPLVILDAELKLDEHILLKLKKANAIAGLIRRTLLYLGCSLLNKYSLA